MAVGNLVSVDSSPRRIAITGAPGAGKSTLLHALEDRGWTVVPEAARTILQQPGGMALRAADPDEFARAMLEADRAAFHAVEPGQTVIFDRGFADVVAFLRIEDRPIPQAVADASRDLRFDLVLRAPAWRAIYRQDAERIQTWEEAVESDQQCLRAWCDYGYEPMDLPLVSVDERIHFVEQLMTS